MREKEFLPLVKEKLNIEHLNEMQLQMLKASGEARDIILLSPTGSGKTLAFVMPVLKMLKPTTGRVQAIIIAPSRELVLQLAGVTRDIARGYKVTALYGGHKVEDEVNSLSVVPDIIVATPGRLLDHINRRNVDVLPTRILVLDEFDKSLELGFEDEMRRILRRLKNVSRTILTSATDLDILPDFLSLNEAKKLSFLSHNKGLRDRLKVHRVDSDGKDKLATLKTLLANIYKENTNYKSVIFVNHRDSADRVSEYLESNGIRTSLYHGGLDQQDREKALTLFNNGSRPILVSTDLGARGLDIESVSNIIHYHQPLTSETYTHRNGRTARMSNEGDVFILIGPEEEVKEYIDLNDTYHLDRKIDMPTIKNFETLRFSAGKKEKLSKGDILGFLIKTGGLESSDIGKIAVYDHYSLAAISSEKVSYVLKRIHGEKIKGRREKIEII
ncbi:MAG: DEAD/DEAH box helicase [Prevotella sp.]|nr:DEAD/DEAH box helicase [Bacteroides sp.]MCM1365985.1 DEAD/DEAH box helicase [Prevotella sp.]MCM1436594.1 DEAD/DEAH box helicase [Prevotella sp.]